jgi:hypothetical protein
VLVAACARPSRTRTARDVDWPGQSTAGKGWTDPNAGHAPRPVTIGSPFPDEEAAESEADVAETDSDETADEETDEPADEDDYGDAGDAGDEEDDGEGAVTVEIEVVDEPVWDVPDDEDDPDEDWDEGE